MKKTAITLTCTMVLSLTLALKNDRAFAEPRNPSNDRRESADERRDRELTEMEAWLRRLVGNYQLFDRATVNGNLKNKFKDGERPDGTIITRLMDCSAIGEGPGVMCIQRNKWQKPGQEDFHRFGLVEVLGMDTNAAKIRILVAHDDGVVSESSGELRGDTVAWQLPCPYVKNLRSSGCRMTMRYTAPAHGEYVRFEGFGGTMSGGGRTSGDIWYRLLEDQDGAANAPDSLLNQPVGVPSLGVDAPAPRGPR